MADIVAELAGVELFASLDSEALGRLAERAYVQRVGRGQVIFIEGEAVQVPPDLEAMQEIAADTGGVSFEAESEQELAAAYEDLGSSIGYEVEQRPITEWFVAAALVFLLAAAGLSLLWFARLP